MIIHIITRSRSKPFRIYLTKNSDTSLVPIFQMHNITIDLRIMMQFRYTVRVFRLVWTRSIGREIENSPVHDQKNNEEKWIPVKRVWFRYCRHRLTIFNQFAISISLFNASLTKSGTIALARMTDGYTNSGSRHRRINESKCN